MHHARSGGPASLKRLQEDADSAAAGEPDPPGGLVLDAELQRFGLGCGQHVGGLGDHRAFDAAA